ncbi:hypothetical protein KIL84_016866 [Mauremys mutica]|uniref:Uncharacterized protein n=1 Tax=Mauremys mutica TaxID=74926 RepID=A0A9D3X5A1_9SAUR|nr:hypothetical protein KIL84_016866 [Mauremys mutica]
MVPPALAFKLPAPTCPQVLGIELGPALPVLSVPASLGPVWAACVAGNSPATGPRRAGRGWDGCREDGAGSPSSAPSCCVVGTGERLARGARALEGPAWCRLGYASPHGCNWNGALRAETGTGPNGVSAPAPHSQSCCHSGKQVPPAVG